MISIRDWAWQGLRQASTWIFLALGFLVYLVVKLALKSLEARLQPKADKVVNKLADRLAPVPVIGRPFRLPAPPSTKDDTPPAIVAPEVPPEPPPFAGHDYTTDILGGIRWRWKWTTGRDGEPGPCDIKAYCPRDDCDFPLKSRGQSDSRSPYHRWTEFTCQNPHCRSEWNRKGDFNDVISNVDVLIETNARTGRRGDPGPRAYSEEEAG